ncbi:hypothetical protein VNO77_03361 [Canavalia gladiata]|uniref:Uncharacterized protein n=1 Tax=Canavalia gladiata TaxID=3824 RepID=A0AAN9R6T3_CANGL
MGTITNSVPGIRLSSCTKCHWSMEFPIMLHAVMISLGEMLKRGKSCDHESPVLSADKPSRDENPMSKYRLGFNSSHRRGLNMMSRHPCHEHFDHKPENEHSCISEVGSGKPKKETPIEAPVSVIPISKPVED